MGNFFWQRCWNVFGAAPRRTKRVARDGRLWEFASERLEARALLSATSLAPVAAEVSHGKKVFQFPNVEGSWTINLGEMGTASVTFTQDGPNVDSDMQLPIIGQVTSSDNFTKKNHHELNGKIKLTTETLGKVTVRLNVEFPEVAIPTTFTGEANITGKNLDEPLELHFTGTRNPTMTLLAPSHGPKVAPTSPPNVSGAWTLTGTSGDNSLQRIINITQSGPDGIKVSARVIGDPAPAKVTYENSIKIKGKFDTENFLHVTGKMSFSPTPSTTFKGRFEITFNLAIDSFTGVLHTKQIGDIQLSGDKGGVTT